MVPTKNVKNVCKKIKCMFAEIFINHRVYFLYHEALLKYLYKLLIKIMPKFFNYYNLSLLQNYLLQQELRKNS